MKELEEHLHQRVIGQEKAVKKWRKRSDEAAPV